MKRALLLFVLFALCSSTLLSQEANSEFYNCFAVIAGKEATADGSVLLAHNEDDSGEQMLNIYVVPRGQDQMGCKGESAKYFWCEFPGMEVADGFLNEYGVGVVSNSCPSKEDREDFTDGGVLYEVRRLVAQKARSSKEAVKLLGQLVEQRGYRGSGRTYSIADANEAWIFSAVQGRHWVAQRVPDNCVMALPNNYIIDRVDLSDTLNFAGSEDLVEYAIERGWYNPQTDGPFSFKKAYCKPSTYISDRNVLRHKNALQYLTGRDYNNNPDSFELFVVPNRKITIEDMIGVLSIDGIWVKTTVVSTIFQLRRDMPSNLASVMWVAAGKPCIEPFFPWYIGIGGSAGTIDKGVDIPQILKEFGRFSTAEEAYKAHFTDAKGMRSNYPHAATWRFEEKWEWLNEDYEARLPELKKERDLFQQRIFEEHYKFEEASNYRELGEYLSDLYRDYFKKIAKYSK